MRIFSSSSLLFFLFFPHSFYSVSNPSLSFALFHWRFQYFHILSSKLLWFLLALTSNLTDISMVNTDRKHSVQQYQNPPRSEKFFSPIPLHPSTSKPSNHTDKTQEVRSCNLLGTQPCYVRSAAHGKLYLCTTQGRYRTVFYNPFTTTVFYHPFTVPKRSLNSSTSLDCKEIGQQYRNVMQIISRKCVTI